MRSKWLRFVLVFWILFFIGFVILYFFFPGLFFKIQSGYTGPDSPFIHVPEAS